MRTLIYFILALLLVSIFESCKTHIQYVPVETIKTEYINKYHRDSIQLYDSIYIREKNDTIWMEKYKYIYRNLLKIDTVSQIDTIRIPYPVTQYVEVNKINWWQRIFIGIGILSSLALVIFITIKLR